MSSVNLSVKGVGPVQHFENDLPAIIFLHGMASSRLTWENFIWPIANGTGRKVFTYDARNHGDSGWSNDFGYDWMVTDLENIMSNLQMSKTTLVGHSMGGKVALKFALKRPEMVEKLIIEDISPKPRPPSSMASGFVRAHIAMLRQSLKAIPEDVTSLEKAKEIVATFIRDQVPPEQQHEKDISRLAQELPLKREEGQFRWKTNLDAIQEPLATAHQYEPIEGTFDGPTLFLYRTKSIFNIIKEKDYILKHFPNATFSAIEGGGHSLHAEFPEEFTKKLVDFFNNS